MKRVIALFLVVLFSISLFAGCGSAGDKASDTTQSTSGSAAGSNETTADANVKKISGTITYATNRTNTVDTTIKALADEFTKKYPDVKVEIEGIKDPDSVIKTRMAADELPDVTLIPASVPAADLPKYFAPIDDIDIFTKDNLYFYDAGLSTDGRLYKVSGAILYAGIVYNKRVFEKAGITAVPRTTEEFMKACEAIKAQGIVPVATNFRDKWPIGRTYFNEFATALNMNGGYLNDLANQDKLIDGEGLAGIKFIRSMVEKGYTDPDLMSTNWDGSKKDMLAGKIGMTVLEDWYTSDIFAGNTGNAEDIGMFPYPDAKCIATLDDWYFAVSKNSKNIDAAKEWLKFLFEDGRLSLAHGCNPSLKSVAPPGAATKELLNYGLPVVEYVPRSDAFIQLINKTQTDIDSMMQEVILANNLDEIVNKYNTKWAEARK